MIFKRFQNKNKKPKRQKRGKRNTLGPSIVTADVVMDGHLLSNGELQIDGEVNGDVRAKAVVVDINGIVHGEVVAEDVIVRGRIIGPIRALHVHLLKDCHVEGDILNETVSIENGAFIDGQIHRVEAPLSDLHARRTPSYNDDHSQQHNFEHGDPVTAQTPNFPKKE